MEKLNGLIAALESAVLRIGLLVLTICKLVEFVRMRSEYSVVRAKHSALVASGCQRA